MLIFRVATIGLCIGAVLIVGQAANAQAADVTRDPPQEVSGSLNAQGQSIYLSVRNVRADDSGQTVDPVPPATYAWASWPINIPGICEDGQIGWNAYRIDNATGNTIRFFRDDGAGPYWYNSIIVGGADATDVWFVHVCIGPPRIDVEGDVEALLPTPELGISPGVGTGGVTGLETWFWYDQGPPIGPAGPEVAVTLNVYDEYNLQWYQVDGLAWASGYLFDTGDGTVFDTNIPGWDDESGAAGTHMYETKGTYTINYAVTWVGEYTYTGYTGTEVMGPINLNGSDIYVVNEIRPVLTHGSDG